jgi:rod shape-determining protein MreC
LKSIAQGTGNATQLDLLHIPVSADIQVGDLLVSSGLGGRFPANYPVATISEINHTPGNSFATVTATPTAALAKASEVLLIWSTSNVPSENNNDTPALEEETNE